MVSSLSRVQRLGCLSPSSAVTSALLRPSRRTLVDISVRPDTQKPLIRYGTGGRSSVSGHVATVFGANGYLGHYLVSKLAKAGTQVIVPYRSQVSARKLRVMGDLGQIVPMEWEMRNPHQIEECLRHSDVVYNLAGRHSETRNYSFEDVNVTGAGLIADIAAKNGVSRFIHVSHLNANHDSPSGLYRSKARGEEAVLDKFPEATIVRPGVIYGNEDRLIQQAAVWPMVNCQNHGRTLMRPVHFPNIAQALHNLLPAKSTQGLTLNLPGPRTMSNREFLLIVMSLTMRTRYLSAMHYPKPLFKLFARIMDRAFYWQSLDADMVERMYIDDPSDLELRRQIRAGVGNGMMLNSEQSWERCGIKMSELDLLEDVSMPYLRRWRPRQYSMVPSHAGPIGNKTKEYRVPQ